LIRETAGNGVNLDHWRMNLRPRSNWVKEYLASQPFVSIQRSPGHLPQHAQHYCDILCPRFFIAAADARTPFRWRAWTWTRSGCHDSPNQSVRPTQRLSSAGGYRLIRTGCLAVEIWRRRATSSPGERRTESNPPYITHSLKVHIGVLFISLHHGAPSWSPLCSCWAAGSKSTPKQWWNRGMVFIFLKPSFTVGWRRIEPGNLGSWHQLAPDAKGVWEDRDDPDKLGPHARHPGEVLRTASQYARQRREAAHRAPQVGDSVCVCGMWIGLAGCSWAAWMWARLGWEGGNSAQNSVCPFSLFFFSNS
jgi:hypothetical protein